MVNNPPLTIFKAGDLLLIEDEKPQSQSNFVKLCLSLLREAGLRPPIQFATLDSLVQIDPSTTLESLLCQHSLDNNLTHMLNELKNKSLSLLIQNTLKHPMPIQQADLEQQHLIALCMSLLAQKPYLIFDLPEDYLNDSNQKIFFEALIFELQQHKKIAFVRTRKPQIWEPMATKKVIVKGTQTSVVPLIKEKIRSRFLEINETTKMSQQEGLLFHWPEQQHKKAA